MPGWIKLIQLRFEASFLVQTGLVYQELFKFYLYHYIFQEKDLEKLKTFIETKKPHVVAVTAENK